MDIQKKFGQHSQLEQFGQLEGLVEGFFTAQNAALWDALLSFQTEQNIVGDFLEIGVYKGRSALLSALHLRNSEQFHLIDGTHFLEEAEQHLGPILAQRGQYIQKMSYEISHQDLQGIRHRCRWVHIDGEHTGRAVWNDLELCEQVLSSDGVLILDDFFNPMYPQLSEAAFAFLAQNKYKLSMFLCGWNKAYLARPLYALHYRAFVHQFLAAELHCRAVHDFMLTKTATIDESGAFGICHRFADRDYYGLDSNPDFIPCY
jgi:hypothetical protein